MIITPHMLAGAALGHHSPGIVTAFGLGLISHFVLDNIPHWDYLSEIKLNNTDHLVKIAIDLVIACSLTIILVFSLPNKIIIFAAVAGALLPDILEALYQNYKIKALKTFSKFHLKIHSKARMNISQGLFGLAIVIIVSALALVL